MDPTAADDESSDVAVADLSAARSRQGSRAKKDTPYRRPPAHPPVESATGGSWFAGGTDMAEPVTAEPDEPAYGPAPPATSGRASFGFTAGPISPVSGRGTSGRQAAAQPGTDQPTRQPGTPGGHARKRSRSAAPPAPAARQAAPTSSSRPAPAARLAPDQTGALRSPSGEYEKALRSPSGEYVNALRSPSGEYEYQDAPRRPSGEYENALRKPSGEYENALRRPSGEFANALRVPSGEYEYENALRMPSGEFANALRVSSGDYAAWPDAETTGERRMAHREAPAEAQRPRQSRAVKAAIVALSLIVLVGGGVVGVVYFTGSNDGVDSVLELGAGGSAKRTVTAPLDNRTKASFELLAGANSVHVTIGELGDDLYRISTPDDAGFRPSPSIRNDDVKLQVTKDGDGTGGEIEVVLAAKVRWALRFSGYAETQVIDMSGGQVSQIEMVAGMRKAEVTLPRPSGTVPLKINGAVDTLILKSPSISPVRIKVNGGAQTVVAGNRTLKDVAAGSTLTPKGWSTRDRYDVTASARINALTIENAIENA